MVSQTLPILMQILYCYQYILVKVLDYIPATAASDLWATGCLLCYMLVDTSPFFPIHVEGDEDAI